MSSLVKNSFVTSGILNLNDWAIIHKMSWEYFMFILKAGVP